MALIFSCGEPNSSLSPAAPKSIVGGGPTYMAPEMLLATREGASYDGDFYFSFGRTMHAVMSPYGSQDQ